MYRHPDLDKRLSTERMKAVEISLIYKKNYKVWVIGSEKYGKSKKTWDKHTICIVC